MANSNLVGDRNLLVGILALQLEFISRDQLIAAMNGWILAKAQPLEQILFDQASLTDDEKALLSALVAKHLEKHGGDPERSLAAVSSVATSVREQLVKLGDGDVEASLLHATAASRDLRDLPETISIGRSTSQGERFRVLRPHAKGGLGEVFVASDGELHREVALKQIQQDHADDPHSRARFILEAEYTGGLEHPGIVPVYGLGQYADGRPFYAMRFIRGDSLQEAIRRFHKAGEKDRSASESSLQLRKLLGRFIDVCDAIEYAHSRGVLHRDLKPGNVMLGKYGETLVVDWGLAKSIGKSGGRSPSDEATLTPVSDTGSAPTQMGTAIGTPAYMSPEQACGRLDLLGTASDVYSLGATLYSLLTGEPPFKEDNVASVLQKVERGDFRPPRELNRQIPTPLEAICLKAMALAPQDRYASPRSLAEDIEHWLADEPVSAYRDPLSARAARWARRHKVAVAMVSVLLLTALVSMSIGAVLLAGANHRIRAAQQLAEHNERTANENFRLARKSVQDYLTTVSQETLFDEPGMQPLREKLLSSALEYYQEFVRRRGDDPQLQKELSEAVFLVGTIKARIGSHQDSLAAFREAVEINHRLVQQDPASIALRFTLARCYSAMATSLSDVGKLDEAFAASDQAVQLLTGLAEQDPDDVLVAHELQSIYSNQGSLFHDQGKLQEALRSFQQSLKIGDRLVAAKDEDGEFRNTHAGTHHNLAELVRKTGDQEKAVEHYVRAIEIRERLIEAFPRKQLYLSKVSLCYNGLANTYAHLGRFHEAVNSHKKAVEIREQLVRANPAVTEYHDLLAGSYSNLGSEYRQLGDLEKAADLGLKATAIWKRLSDQHPEIVGYRKSIGTAFYNLGNLLLGNPALDSSSSDQEARRKQAGDAVRHYLDSIAVYESLVEEFPSIPEYQSALANSLNNCGSAYHLLADEEKSRQMNEKALVLRERLVASFPSVPEYRNELASTYTNLVGPETERTKKYELLTKAIELRQTLVDDFPDVPDYRFKLAFSLQGIALHQVMDGDNQQAQPTFARIITLTEQLHAEFPDVPVYRKMLAQALELQAAGLRLAGNWKQAVESQQKLVAVFDRLLAKEPSNVEFMIGRARGIQGIGTSYHKGREFDTALIEYARAVEVLMPFAERNSQAAAALGKVIEYRVDVFESLKRYEDAIRDLSQLVKLSKSALPIRIQRARFRSLSGAHAAAADEIGELLAADEKLDKTDLYNAACVFSLAVAALKTDSSLTDDRRETLRAKYLEQGVNCLRLARQAGCFSSDSQLKHFSQNSDFDPLREEPAFIEFQKQLTAVDPKSKQ